MDGNVIIFRPHQGYRFIERAHPQRNSTAPATSSRPHRADRLTSPELRYSPVTDENRDVVWKLNREMVLLLGWGRAILLQLAHPLVAAGVANHSAFLAQPRGRVRRFAHTVSAMLALTFGTPDEVARAAAGINGIHDRVHGRLCEPTGSFEGGTPYSAHDPALLRWVHATLLDSTLRVYVLYVGPLTAEEQDRYCAAASGVAPLLGIPEGYLPASVAELEAFLRSMFTGGEIAVGETARKLARAVVYPPCPRVARPFLWLVRLPTIGLLPPAIRRAYGLPWDARQALALRLSARLVRRLLPLLPSVCRHWPAARAAARRVSDPRRRHLATARRALAEMGGP